VEPVRQPLRQERQPRLLEALGDLLLRERRAAVARAREARQALDLEQHPAIRPRVLRPRRGPREDGAPQRVQPAGQRSCARAVLRLEAREQRVRVRLLRLEEVRGVRRPESKRARLRARIPRWSCAKRAATSNPRPSG
jgi:hypothetical protein